MRWSANNGPVMGHMAFRIRVADMILIVAMGLIAHLIRMETLVIDGPYIVVILLGLVLHQVFAGLFRLYRINWPVILPAMLASLVASLLITFLAMTGIGYLAKVSDFFSRLWVGYWLAGSLCSMLLARLLLVAAARRGTTRRTAVTLLVIGHPGVTRGFTQQLDTHSDSWHRLKIHTPEEILATPEAIMQTGEIILIGPLGDADLSRSLVMLLRTSPARVRYVLEEPLAGLQPTRPELLAGRPVVDILQAPLSESEALMKRGLDVLMAGLLLLLTAPVLALAALCIRQETPGPVLFRQQRTGFGGHSFIAYKLRTMHTDMGDDCGGAQAQAGDRRVTRVGHFLRRTSIDELPQLFNVLIGDMSLVGPRPHALTHDIDFSRTVDIYAARRRMKPGLTGWAQVNGLRGPFGGDNSLERRVSYDLAYIENWNIGFDLWILFLTPFHILLGRNAV